MSPPSASWSSAASTDPGRRDHNEDAWLCNQERGLFVVTDGVGGRQAGEVAARLACELIDRQSGSGDSLAGAITAAHRAILAQAEDPQAPGRHGMACTAVALRLTASEFELAWSGDSRAYFWDGQLRRLSRDHSLVEALIARGELARRDAFDHPQKNVILSALGGEDRAPEIGSIAGPLPGPGIFLLCTDGLSDMLAPDAICRILERSDSLELRCAALTNAARDLGGHDNITTLLVELHGPDTGGAELTAEEVFDPATGEVHWPRDGSRSLAPSVRRLRSRRTTGDTGTGHDRDTTLIDTQPPDAAPQAPRRQSVPWAALLPLAVLLLVAASIAAWYLL